MQRGITHMSMSNPPSKLAPLWRTLAATILSAMLAWPASGARAQTASPASTGPRPAVASRIDLSGDARRTQFRIAIDRPVIANIFTLSDPYRAIVDIADLEFNLPATANTRLGLVADVRYGQFEPGRARIVIDATAPVRIENADFRPPSGRGQGALTFDLVGVTPGEFTALSREGAAAHLAAAKASQIDDWSEIFAGAPGPSSGEASKNARPVIVIDPGHGGIDPGTVATSNVAEKTVVLAVAKQVAALLTQTRRFDVHLTRRDDVFVSLDRRLRISEQHGADLFISLHADALAEKDLVQAVHGATVYTLSDRASDEAARKLADKENAADKIAGIDITRGSEEDKVRHILVDLVRRETSNFAAEFRQQLLGALRGRVPLSKDPARSAAFKVLKQAETPAVLIELGYMSNTEDLARLVRPEWQAQAAASIVAAVETHFARRTARARPASAQAQR